MGSIIDRPSRDLATINRRPITNFAELLDALAMGWVEGSHDNRIVIAGHYGQFVRVAPRRYGNRYHKKQPGDIAIESGGYRLQGFIRFEIPSIFRELFTTGAATDGDWYCACLTLRGYEMTKAGIFDFTGLSNHAFFVPESTNIVRDKEISMDKRHLASPVPAPKGETP